MLEALISNKNDSLNSSHESVKVLISLTRALNQLHTVLYNHSFFNYIQHYPDRIEENIHTRMAHDLIRKLGEMDS